MKRGLGLVTTLLLITMPQVLAQNVIVDLFLGQSTDSEILLRLMYALLIFVVLFKSSKEQLFQGPENHRLAVAFSLIVAFIVMRFTPIGVLQTFGWLVTIVVPFLLAWLIIGFAIKKGEGFSWLQLILSLIFGLLILYALGSSAEFTGAIGGAPGIGPGIQEFFQDSSYFFFSNLADWFIVPFIIGIVLLLAYLLSLWRGDDNGVGWGDILPILIGFFIASLIFLLFSWPGLAVLAVIVFIYYIVKGLTGGDGMWDTIKKATSFLVENPLWLLGLLLLPIALIVLPFVNVFFIVLALTAFLCWLLYKLLMLSWRGTRVASGYVGSTTVGAAGVYPVLTGPGIKIKPYHTTKIIPINPGQSKTLTITTYKYPRSKWPKITNASIILNPISGLRVAPSNTLTTGNKGYVNFTITASQTLGSYNLETAIQHPDINEGNPLKSLTYTIQVTPEETGTTGPTSGLNVKLVTPNKTIKHYGRDRIIVVKEGETIPLQFTLYKGDYLTTKLIDANAVWQVMDESRSNPMGNISPQNGSSNRSGLLGTEYTAPDKLGSGYLKMVVQHAELGPNPIEVLEYKIQVIPRERVFRIQAEAQPDAISAGSSTMIGVRAVDENNDTITEDVTIVPDTPREVSGMFSQQGESNGVHYYNFSSERDLDPKVYTFTFSVSIPGYVSQYAEVRVEVTPPSTPTGGGSSGGGPTPTLPGGTPAPAGGAAGTTYTPSTGGGPSQATTVKGAGIRTEPIANLISTRPPIVRRGMFGRVKTKPSEFMYRIATTDDVGTAIMIGNRLEDLGQKIQIRNVRNKITDTVYSDYMQGLTRIIESKNKLQPISHRKTFVRDVHKLFQGFFKAVKRSENPRIIQLKKDFKSTHGPALENMNEGIVTTNQNYLAWFFAHAKEIDQLLDAEGKTYGFVALKQLLENMAIETNKYSKELRAMVPIVKKVQRQAGI